MVTCSYCNAKYVKNTLFCAECGQYLGEDDSRKTESFANSGAPPDPKRARDTLSISRKRPAPTGALSDRPDPALPVTCLLRIGPHKREVQCRINRTIHVGRLDPAHDIFPDIDLTADDRLRREVSRRHLRIFDRENTIVVEDLGSFNGTYLNGKKLHAFEPTALADGDLLQLGSLPIEISIVN